MKIFLVFSLLSAISFPASAALKMLNQEELQAQLGTSMWMADADQWPQLKIAILDNGFNLYEEGRDMLPESTVLLESPRTSLSPSVHGLGMAVISWGLMGRPTQGPQFYLIPTEGWTNFRAGIDAVIENDIDIVIYSQNWEFGSNFMGGGFINNEVNRAVDHGVIWFNAAGNFRNQVYTAPVLGKKTQTGFLSLPSPGDTLRIVNREALNEISVTVSWSDFQESSDYNTSKDLNIFLYSAEGSLVAESKLIQRGEAPTAENRQLSSHARESFKVNLDEGEYRLKIQDASENFDSSDHFRVVVTSSHLGSIEFVDAEQKSEILAPADNPNVFTVGDCSPVSSRGPTVSGLSKPDFVIPNSGVSFNSSRMGSTFGSSNATAIAASIVGLMKIHYPRLNNESLRRYIKTLRARRSNNELDCGDQPVWRTPTPSQLRRFL